MKIKYINSVLLLEIFFVISLFSQSESFNEDWRWVHFTTESGLPSNIINEIYEASDSVVWVSTPSGLAWFDGFRWNTVSKENFGIEGVFRDGIIARKNDSLFLISHQTEIRFLQNNVTSAFPLSSDSIIVFRNGKLALYLFNSLGTFQIHEMISPINMNKPFRTRSGNLWAEAGKTLYRMNNGQWEPVLSSSSGEFVVGGGARAPYQVEDNHAGAGLLYITRPHRMQGIWEWYGYAQPKRATTEKPEILNAMDIGPQNQAVAVYRPDIIRYRSNGVWQTLNLEKFLINDILSVRFCSSGDLLIGTGHGLFRFSSSVSRWQLFQHPSPDPRNTVNEIILTDDSTIWSATSDGLEIRFPDGDYEYINQIDTIHLYSLTGLCEDIEGNIWISSGSAFSGAFRWDGKQWKHFAIGDNPENVAIHKIRKDRQNNLWFLGIGMSPRMMANEQPGAYLLQNGEFIRWGEPEGLLHGRVYSFAEGKDGELWFGTVNGLSRWKPSTSNPAKVTPIVKRANLRRVVSEGTWTYWTD
ncbi:MAG: hypothetical protein HYZ33_05215 [Ignavibacteriales bacterium]|nr:hypothetical protein [Ignavibacteriales bacterium]